MKREIILLLLFVSARLLAQNTDSLFNKLVELKERSKKDRISVVAGGTEEHKCAFGLMADIKKNYNKFTSAQRSVITALMSRPQADTSVVSPKKYFRIHFYSKLYYDAGEGRYIDKRPSYNVDAFAAAADSAYEFEVKDLGYPPPPSDNSAGGDDLYDIYIDDLDGYYGWTTFENETSDNYYTTFITVDNDFNGYYTTGLNAARVTIAHEFHHAIQVGSYVYRSEDQYYNEISSTAMEEFVFSDVNDYLNYLPSFFNNPAATISNHSGYDLGIFNVYLKERFGYTALRKIWENINSFRALKAINITLEENSASFKNELAGFYTWTFFTGFRSIDGKYFKDARKFPLLKPVMTVNYSASEKAIDMATEPVSCNLLLFVNALPAKPDSIYALVANTDYNNGYLDVTHSTDCKYYLSPSNSTGAKQLSEGYYVKYTSPVPDLLKDVDFLNNELVEGSAVIEAGETGDPFPQPFNYTRHSSIAVPVPKGDSDESLLYIYTVNMRLVYSGSLKVIKTDKLFVRWSGLDGGNSRLPNGVYFYFTKRDDKIKKGKLIIQNE